MIAILVPEDSDMCRMARTCRYFAEAIIPPNSGVWRTRFLDKYDHPPPDKSSEEVGIEYKVRSIMLAQTPSFQDGEGSKEKLWLSVLTTLLVGMSIFIFINSFESVHLILQQSPTVPIHISKGTRHVCPETMLESKGPL